MGTIEKANERVGDGEKSLAYLPIACTLSPDEFQTRKSEHLIEVGKSLLERVELPDGYSFRFPGGMFDRLAGVVGLERRCCSFLRFSLTAEPGNGPVWVAITGPVEAKEFLATFWE